MVAPRTPTAAMIKPIRAAISHSAATVWRNALFAGSAPIQATNPPSAKMLPVFRGTRVPVHMLAELVLARVRARTRYRRGKEGQCARYLEQQAACRRRGVDALLIQVQIAPDRL